MNGQGRTVAESCVAATLRMGLNSYRKSIWDGRPTYEWAGQNCCGKLRSSGFANGVLNSYRYRDIEIKDITETWVKFSKR